MDWSFLSSMLEITESKRNPRAINLPSKSWITSSFEVQSFTAFPERFLITLQIRKINTVLARHLKVWQTGGLERQNQAALVLTYRILKVLQVTFLCSFLSSFQPPQSTEIFRNSLSFLDRCDLPTWKDGTRLTP